METYTDILSSLNILTRGAVSALLFYSMATINGFRRWQRGVILIGAISALCMAIAYITILFMPVGRIIFRTAAPLVAAGCVVVIYHVIKQNMRLNIALRKLVEKQSQG